MKAQKKRKEHVTRMGTPNTATHVISPAALWFPSLSRPNESGMGDKNAATDAISSADFKLALFWMERGREREPRLDSTLLAAGQESGNGESWEQPILLAQFSNISPNHSHNVKEVYSCKLNERMSKLLTTDHTPALSSQERA